MRFRTLEIRWHDSKPISTCDFQPVSYKKARPGPKQERNYAGQSYRLVTGGEDNHVMVRKLLPDATFAYHCKHSGLDGTSKYKANLHTR